MIWHPEEKDARVNEYLEQANHAPYSAIAGYRALVCCVFTFTVLFAIV